MDHQPTSIEPSFWEKNRMLFKGFLIGFLTLVMLIPAAFLSELVTEREQRQTEVTTEISSKWASAQTILGPVLVIPYLEKVDSQKAPVRRNLYVLPDQLNINGQLLPEVRHRSLYDVTLYRSDLVVKGAFDARSLKKLNIPAENLLINECYLMLGLDDARGLEDDVHLRWDSMQVNLETGVPENNVIKNGLSLKVPFSNEGEMQFIIHLKVKGSSHLCFTPVGKTTEVSVASKWKDPSFDGQYLPIAPAKVSDSGFVANWKVLQVARSYPQAWKDGATYDLSSSAFGVKLLQPTDSYAKTQRSVKYAILIISLTFIIFFFVEIFQKRQIHPLQYILVGIALCVFYTLLLSISEYTGFNPAYLIATTATVGLITLYIYGIFKQVKIAAGFALALGGLYTYIFVLIQLQDYALLYGSIGLFLILSVVMYYSRKIDWYSTYKPQEPTR